MIIHHESHSLRPAHNTSAASQPRPEIPSPHRQVVLDPLQLRHRRVARTRHHVHRSKIISRPVNRGARSTQVLLRHGIAIKEHQVVLNTLTRQIKRLSGVGEEYLEVYQTQWEER